MSLYNELKTCKNEADVERLYKNAFEKVLKKEEQFEITRDTRNDGILTTKYLNTLMEFKYDHSFNNVLSRSNVIIQCLYYLKDLKHLGKQIPTSIFIGDMNECFILDTKLLYKYFNREIVGSASTAHLNNHELIADLCNDNDIQEYSAYLYDITENFKLNEIVDTLKEIHDGNLTKVKLNKHNVSLIFETFKKEVLGKNKLTVNECVNLFLQLVLNPNDNGLNHNSTKLITKNYGSIPVKNFKSFFKRYEGIDYTPVEKEQLTTYADRMIEDETRRRKGEFYTPTIWVDEAHKEISNHLGADWKEKYIVWDCACGSGNLTRDYKFKELYLSTLEQSDIDTMNEMDYNPEAVKFQYDFLNDDMDKLPKPLRDAIETGKEILFFINPPYATGANMGTKVNNNKSGVAFNKINKMMIDDDMRTASRNLYVQFLYRIYYMDIKNNITIACYTKSLYKSGPSFIKFRNKFLNNFRLKYSMLFCANHFSETSNKWAIDFSIWEPQEELYRNKFKSYAKHIHENHITKYSDKLIYNTDDIISLSKWSRVEIKKLKKYDVPQMSSYLTISKDGTGKFVPNCLGTILSNSNNVYYNNTHVTLFSSAYHSGFNSFCIIPENFYKVTTLFAARKSIKGTWINDKDEYIAPNESHSDWQQFVNDSIVYSLFNNSSQQSSLRQIEYKDKLWDIKNEFFWLSNQQIQDLANNNNYDELYKDAKNNNNDRFVYEKLKTTTLSADAQKVLNMATDLLIESIPMRKLMAQQNPEYHLNSWCSGYAQLKLVWDLYHKDKFKAFKAEYKKFEQRLIPMIYELGFLRK
jgi:hypothetical protein